MEKNGIDSAMAEAIMADLHERLGLTSPCHITVLAVAWDVQDVLRFGSTYRESLSVYHWSPETLIFTREPLGGGQYWLSLQAYITPTNLHKLPTAELRAQARALLGLETVVEEKEEEKEE